MPFILASHDSVPLRGRPGVCRRVHMYIKYAEMCLGSYTWAGVITVWGTQGQTAAIIMAQLSNHQTTNSLLLYEPFQRLLLWPDRWVCGCFHPTVPTAQQLNSFNFLLYSSVSGTAHLSWLKERQFYLYSTFQTLRQFKVLYTSTTQKTLKFPHILQTSSLKSWVLSTSSSFMLFTRTCDLQQRLKSPLPEFLSDWWSEIPHLSTQNCPR